MSNARPLAPEPAAYSTVPLSSLLAASSPRGRGRLLVWGLLYLVAGVAIATASAWNVYQTPRLAIVAGAGTALGIGAVLLARALKWRGWAVLALTAAGYLLLVVPVAIPDALTSPVEALRGVRDGIVGIVVGWKQLLTLSLPLGDYQAVLVPFFVLVVAGTALAAYLIAREGAGTAAVAGIVVAMSCFGIVFGTSSTGPAFLLGGFAIPAPREVLLGVLLVLLSVLWLVGRARLRRAAALRSAQASSVRQGVETIALRVRRQVAAVLLVVIALVAGIALAPLAQTLVPRQALRDDVDPLLIVRQQPSPLSAYRASFTDAGLDAELFTVAGATGVDRIRIATLDFYDGDEFRVSTDDSGSGDDGVRYVRLPGGIPGPGPTVTISIGAGYSGIWLPVPDGVTAAPDFRGSRSVALADGFYQDAASGSAIEVAAAGDGTGSGDDTVRGLTDGDSYSVVAGTLATPQDFAGEEGTESRISADDYPQLAAWVERQGVPRTGAGLAELVDRLRERGYLSHSLTDDEGATDWVTALEARGSYEFLSSRAGHSAARLEALFTDLNGQEQRAGEDADPDALVAAVGDDEQFAAAAALLARYLGFDSRVVLGVRLAPADSPSSDGIPVCSDVCTGQNLTAWVEVGSPTGGWTALDATPQFEVAPISITDGEKLPENPTTPDQPDIEPLDPPQAQRDDSEAPDSDASAAPGWLEALLPALRVVGTIALAGLLVLLPLLVLAIAKLVRRRSRRDDALPEVSLVGAWSELVARYVDLGYDVPEHVSRTAVADAVARPRALALATVVDRAVFSEHAPAPEASHVGWQLVDDERRELAAETPLRRRMLAAVAPASLLRDLGATRATLERRLPFLRKAYRR